MTAITAAAFVTLFVSPFILSIGEWIIHKKFMHAVFWVFTYPYESHNNVHHVVFGADDTYHLENRPVHEKKYAREKIAMAWWAFLIVIPAGTTAFIIAAAPFAFLGMWNVAYTVVGIGCLATSVYFATYETIHWWMHLPLKRRPERSRVFMWVNGHHLLHHRYPHRNLNVVLPIADIVLGTMLWRSPVKFAQVRGPSVPDVQPI